MLFSIVQYKINTQKLVVLYTLITNYQKENIRKLYNLQLYQTIKYLEINLTKNIEDLDLENYKKLKKEVEVYK